MGRKPTSKLKLLNILKENPIDCSDGRAHETLWDLYKNSSTSTKGAYTQLFRKCLEGELIAALREGKKYYIIEITKKGLDFIEKEKFRVSKDVVVNKQTLQPNPKNLDSKTEITTDFIESLIDFMSNLLEKASQVSILEDEVSRLNSEIIKLNSELVKAQAKHLILSEELKALKVSEQPKTTDTSDSSPVRARDVPKDLQEVAKKAISKGWKIFKTNGNHIKWVPPVIISSSTPSDKRSLANTSARLKRFGLQDI